MRIALDPIPLCLGIYAYVGTVLADATEKRESDGAEALGRRMARQRQSADREVQKMVRVLHSDVKVADKLLKKTGDLWKISQETDLVDLVIEPRGGGTGPRAYVLLKAREIRPLLASVREAAVGTGEGEETLADLDAAIDALDVRSGDYMAFGFDPWTG